MGGGPSRDWQERARWEEEVRRQLQDERRWREQKAAEERVERRAEELQEELEEARQERREFAAERCRVAQQMQMLQEQLILEAQARENAVKAARKEERTASKKRLEKERRAAEQKLEQELKHERARVHAAKFQEWQALNREYPIPEFLNPYISEVLEDITLDAAVHRYMNVGVLGNSGAGKSSLIKAILARFNSSKDVMNKQRPVISFEGDGTCQPTPYRLGEFNGLVHIWDLPGQGTAKFPSKTYLCTMGLKYFDALLVITDGRWTENDSTLLQAIRFAGIWCAVVRTKVDHAVDDGMNDHGYTQEQTLNYIRMTLAEQVEEADPNKLYLVTTRTKYWAGSHGGAKFGTIDALCEEVMKQFGRELDHGDQQRQEVMSGSVLPEDSVSQCEVAQTKISPAREVLSSAACATAGGQHVVETTNIAGEKSSVINENFVQSFHIGSEVNSIAELENQSCDPDTGAPLSAGIVFVESPRSPCSEVSNASLISATALHGPRCFMKDTHLKNLMGHLVPAHQLEQWSCVCSASGVPVRVMTVVNHPPQERHLVELVAGSTKLVVTVCHRIMVDQGGKHLAVPAETLKTGDSILCSGGDVKTLEKLQHLSQSAEVVEVVFAPDEPVETFHLQPEAILTKGRAPASPAGQHKVRRGGMSKRGRSWKGLQDKGSIPDTHNSWD